MSWSETNCGDSEFPVKEADVSCIFKIAERNKHTQYKGLFFTSANYSPMGVNDLAECQFTAHSEIGLVVWEYRGWCSHGVHFTIFLWLIQGPYELPYKWHFISNSKMVDTITEISSVLFIQKATTKKDQKPSNSTDQMQCCHVTCCSLGKEAWSQNQDKAGKPGQQVD